MKIDIKYNPAYAMATIDLQSGEEIKAESGAMVSKSSNVTIETHRSNKGKSILKSLKSAFLAGESFWMNTFRAEGGKGEVCLAPLLTGDIKQIDLSGTVFVQSSSFMAGMPDMEIDTKFQGFKGFFSGESLFFLKISGKGPLLISSYGGIEELDVHDRLIVDTGHIVAFEEGLEYSVRKFGGWKSFFFSGEGLVCEFRGTGKVWVQSRNVAGLSGWLREKLPPKKK